MTAEHKHIATIEDRARTQARAQLESEFSDVLAPALHAVWGRLAAVDITDMEGTTTRVDVRQLFQQIQHQMIAEALPGRTDVLLSRLFKAMTDAAAK